MEKSLVDTNPSPKVLGVFAGILVRGAENIFLLYIQYSNSNELASKQVNKEVSLKKAKHFLTIFGEFFKTSLSLFA